MQESLFPPPSSMVGSELREIPHLQPCATLPYRHSQVYCGNYVFCPVP
jgi:hypothetical protein